MSSSSTTDHATRAVAEHLSEAWPGRCILLRHPDGGNHGVSASRNLGIASSRSGWVALLDADDFYLPNRFDELRKRLGQTECFDALYEMCEIRNDAEGQAPAPALAGNRFGIATRLTGDALLHELLKGRCWATSAITLRRELLLRTGSFDPGKRIAEDCDLWFRIASTGRVISGSLDRPVSVYWRHGDNTYQYKPEHRVAMVHAMLDGWHWARRNDAGRQILDIFAEAVPVYVMRSIIAVRGAGEPRVAWRIIALVAMSRNALFFLHPKMLRQVLSLVREKFHRTS